MRENSSAGEPTVNASVDMSLRPGWLTSPRWAMNQPTAMTTQMVEMPLIAPCTAATLVSGPPGRVTGPRP